LQSRNSDNACALACACVSAYVLAYAHAYSLRTQTKRAPQAQVQTHRREEEKHTRRQTEKRRGGDMANKNSYDKQESSGLGWTSQAGRNFDEDGTANKAGQKGSSKEKLAEVNKKVIAVASKGMEKTKEVVAVGAQKVKSGTSIGLRWIKEKVQKK
jgi:hypothetical protein